MTPQPLTLITKYFILDVIEFLGSPLSAIHQTCKSSLLIILNVFDFAIKKTCNFYIFCAREILKIYQFRLPRDYLGDSLNIMILWFSNSFLPFPMLFPHVSPSVSVVSSGVSSISLFFCFFYQCFACFLFQLLRKIKNNTSLFINLNFFYQN